MSYNRIAVGTFKDIIPGMTKFSCDLRGEHIKEAVLFYDVNEEKYVTWLCHNDANWNGSKAPNRYGFLYSFGLHFPTSNEVQNIKILYQKKLNHEE